MARPTSQSRSRLIAATARLMQTHGYHGTSIKDIARVAEAPIGSMYFLFPAGKDELVVAALTQSADTVRDGLQFMLSSEETPAGVVTGYVTLVEQILTASNYTDGCPIATVALEVAPEHEAITATISSAFESWAEVLTTQLERVGATPENARTLGVLSLAVVEGTLVLARAHRDPAVFHVALDGLLAAVTQLTTPKQQSKKRREVNR